MAQSMLAELWGVEWLYWYQPVLLIVLVVIIVAWMIYRRKQM